MATSRHVFSVFCSRQICRFLNFRNHDMSISAHKNFSISSKCFSENIEHASPRTLSKMKKIAIVATAGFIVVGGITTVKSAQPYNRDARGYDSDTRIATLEDIHEQRDSQDQVDKAIPFLTNVVPDIKPSKEVAGPLNLGLKLTLFQYQTCPFCCKVRAFLDFYGIPYNVVEVNPVLRQQLKFSKYRKVPILLVQMDNKCLQLNDSSVIISIMATHLQKITKDFFKVLSDFEPVTYQAEDGKEVTEVLNKYNIMFGEDGPSDYELQDLANERKWRQWVDNDLVHILSPNIYRTTQEARESFEYFSEVGEWKKNFQAWERYLVIYVGASAMYFIGKRLKKRYNLKEDVRESLYDAARHWMKAIGPDRLFMGGEFPNMADLAVYGVLNSIEGCAAFKDLLRNTKIGPWYKAVQQTIDDHAGLKTLVFRKETTL